MFGGVCRSDGFSLLGPYCDREQENSQSEAGCMGDVARQGWRQIHI